ERHDLLTLAYNVNLRLSYNPSLTTIPLGPFNFLTSHSLGPFSLTTTNLVDIYFTNLFRQTINGKRILDNNISSSSVNNTTRVFDLGLINHHDNWDVWIL